MINPIHTLDHRLYPVSVASHVRRQLDGSADIIILCNDRKARIVHGYWNGTRLEVEMKKIGIASCRLTLSYLNRENENGTTILKNISDTYVTFSRSTTIYDNSITPQSVGNVSESYFNCWIKIYKSKEADKGSLSIVHVRI